MHKLIFVTVLLVAAFWGVIGVYPADTLANSATEWKEIIPKANFARYITGPDKNGTIRIVIRTATQMTNEKEANLRSASACNSQCTDFGKSIRSQVLKADGVWYISGVTAFELSIYPTPYLPKGGIQALEKSVIEKIKKLYKK